MAGCHPLQHRIICIFGSRLPLVRGSAWTKIIQEHVAGGHADLRVIGSEFSKAWHIWAKNQADAPLRDVMSPKVCGGVATVKMPHGFRFDGNAAQARCMISHRNAPNFRLKASNADCTEFKPCIPGFFVEDKIRLVGDVALNIGRSQETPLMYEGFIFLSDNMDFCVGKIRQSAAMVKMHVGQNDMLEIFRSVSKLLHLVDRGLARVERHDRDDAE